MLKKDTIHAYARWEILPKENAQRMEKKLWTNCSSVELLNFMEDGKVVRVIVKKSRIGAERMEEVREEYRQLRKHLWDLVPMQAFISEKCTEWSERQLVTAFCAPVTIAYDIFWFQKNFDFLKRELQTNESLRAELDVFIRWYLALKEEWFFIDLYWEENLVVTREWELKYIDSFMIDMSSRKSLRWDSEARFRKLLELQ